MLYRTVKQLQLIAQGNLQSARAPIMRRDDVNAPQWQGQKYLPQRWLADDLRVFLDGGAVFIGNIRLAHHGVQAVQAAERVEVALADLAGVGDQIARVRLAKGELLDTALVHVGRGYVTVQDTVGADKRRIDAQRT